MRNLPAKPPARTKSADTRREELMDAAQALFLEKGFDTTSVDDIVKGAGVAKGTYYIYFKTKDDVLLALRKRFIGDFQQRVEAAVNQIETDDWSGQLDAWIAAAVSTYLDNFAVHDMVFHQFRPSSERVHQANPVITHLTGLIADGAKAGAWAAVLPHLSAVMVFSAFHGAVDDAISRSSQTSRGQITREVQSFCRLGLGLQAR